MLSTKALGFLIIALVCVHGTSVRGSERAPSKSELMLRLKRLLEMLKEKEHEQTHATTSSEDSLHRNPSEAQKLHMLHRRKKLEDLLRRNPNLKGLLKTWVEKRKRQELALKKSQNDGQDCVPGLFYCRDESENNAGWRKENDVGSRKENELWKLLTVQSQYTKTYCPPGFFFCPRPGRGNDEPEQRRTREREELLRKMFPKGDRFTSRRRQPSKEMEDLDSIIAELHKRQRNTNSQHKPDEQHRVEIVREPASVRKLDEADESTKGKTKHGEKLADDLMKSVQDTDKKSTDMKPSEKQTNFDLNQLMQLLKE